MPLFPPCRHRREPRHRGVYHCHSPKLIGLKMVSPDVCRSCPFVDHHFPGDDDYPPTNIYPDMPVETLVERLAGPPLPWPPGWEDWPVTLAAHRLASERFLAALPPYPAHEYSGRGIVIAGGGRRYFPSLYVTVRALRYVGCRLPIQVWYLGRDDEMPALYAELLRRADVECVDGDAVRLRQPCRILHGWELKIFALLNSPFEEALLLDADCYPVRDPACLFEVPEYGDTGAIFWPDFRDGPFLDWKAFGVAPPGAASIESGQVVVNKRLCWQPLQLAWWYNDHSDWSYLHGYGDKHTLEVAWARCGRPYHRFRDDIEWVTHSFRHAGPGGEPLFVHRCKDKFRFGADDYLNPQSFAVNEFVPELPLETECFGWLAELAQALELAGAPRRPPRSRRRKRPKMDWLRSLHSRQQLERFCIDQARVCPVKDSLVVGRILGRRLLLLNMQDLNIAAHLALDGFWESWVTLAVARQVQPGWNCIDVGANYGYYTVLLASLVGPTGLVLACEPNPHLEPLLRQSLSLNGFTAWTELHPVAVLDASRSVELHIPQDLFANSLNATTVATTRPGETVPVPGRSLDELVAGRRIDFIKIDAEGAERDIWTGMRQTLETNRAVTVLLEFNAGRYAEPEEFVRTIERQGFRLRTVAHDGSLTDVDAAAVCSLEHKDDWMLWLSRD